MNIRQQIITLSNNINTGTIYTDCIQCGSKKKLGITKSVDGIIYNCFKQSCRLKGKIQSQLNKEVLSSILSNSQLEAHTAQFKEFCTPEYLVQGYASPDGLKMALKYNLLTAYQSGLYSTAFDPRLNRQVFYYLDDDKNIIGAVGRALTYGATPKAYIYPNSIKSPWIIGTNDIAVIVEDIFSAIQVCNAGYTGIALSGTSLLIDYSQLLLNYKTVIIALDKDATIKSLEMKKLVDLFCDNVLISILEKDFKDCSIEETKKVIICSLSL